MLQYILPAAAQFVGGLLGRQSNEEQMEANRAQQREFAQNSIQWRVNDARAAGIHPMYALGAPTMSPAIQTMQDPLGASISSMGQDISRAMSANMAPEERNSGVIAALGVERAGLQNELLRAQISRLRVGTGPGVPTVTDPYNTGVPTNDANDASRVTNDPNKITPGAGANPGMGPGANPDVDWIRTSDGGYTIAPSKPVKDRVEDMGIEPWLWSYRNRIVPYISGRQEPPFAPPGGGHWEFSHSNQTWYPVRPRSGGGGW